MAATGVARDLFTVPVLELSFALALGAYLDGLGVHDRSPMRPVVLHFVLKKALALLASVGSPDCPGYLLGFVVLVLNSTTNFHLVGIAVWLMPTHCIDWIRLTQDIVY